MWPPRLIRPAGCPASGSSRHPRRVMPACWTGWAGPGLSAWPGSRAPAATVPACPGTSPRLVSASWRRTGLTARTGAGRARPGPLDAVSAARAAQSGRARGAPKGRDGTVEAVRALMAAKRSARSGRTQTINQARALVLTGPAGLRTRFARHTVVALVAQTAALRPRPGDVVSYATRIALRELGRRAEFPGSQPGRLDELIVPLVTAHPPACPPAPASAPTPRRCCSSPPGTIRSGCAPRPPGHTCARLPRSPHRRAKSPVTASTPAATARLTTPRGGS
jgi:hypothetical protein